MITPKEEKVLNKLHIIGLMVGKGLKSQGVYPNMAKKYLTEAINEINKLMAFIEPAGRDK